MKPVEIALTAKQIALLKGIMLQLSVDDATGKPGAMMGQIYPEAHLLQVRYVPHSAGKIISSVLKHCTH